MARSRFNHEFKMSAVRLVREQGYTVAQAAKSLGVSSGNVRGWVDKLGSQAGGPATGEAALRRQVQRLRQENARLAMERDILKKAAVFFAKEPS